MADATTQTQTKPTDSGDIPTPSVGDVRKATQKGHLPIGSVEQILNKAHEDIVEDVLDIPEWGYAVRVRSFTASESARIKQRGIALRGEEQVINWAEMEIMQFALGVHEPSFTEDQVRELHLKSGSGFARVVGWLESHSGLDREAIQRTKDEFQRSREQSQV